MEAQKLEGQATFERRKRTDWANSQRQLRRERLDRESEAKRTRMRRLVEYDAKNDRMPSLRKQAKAYDRVQSPAFQANAKAVAKTDDNFVRVLASQSPWSPRGWLLEVSWDPLEASRTLPGTSLGHP